MARAPALSENARIDPSNTTDSGTQSVSPMVVKWQMVQTTLSELAMLLELIEVSAMIIWVAQKIGSTAFSGASLGPGFPVTRTVIVMTCAISGPFGQKILPRVILGLL
jgi:hypothetical protein